MTLTRDMRTSLAFSIAILTAFSLFVWGNQRQVHAQSGSDITEEVFCDIDEVFETIGDPLQPIFESECDTGENPPPPPPPPADPQCSDGVDNDGDGKTDWSVPGGDGDPGCSTPTDDDESGGEAPPPAPAHCADGIDNDGDQLVDLADPGCANAEDNDETNEGGGNGGNPQCSDGVDNDGDNLVDNADPGCANAADDNETDESGGGNSDNDSDGDSGGGGSSRRSSGGSQGLVLGAATGECPLYLTGYIRYGAQNDLAEVLKLQAFLNDFEGHALQITGVYDAPTRAAVNAFQTKYASEVLTPWGLQGPTGYVYYTTQRMVNEIHCRGQREFELSEEQLSEIAQTRSVSGQARQAPVGAGTQTHNRASATPAVGAVVLPETVVEQPAEAGAVYAESATAAAANATSTRSWFERFVGWIFGR